MRMQFGPTLVQQLESIVSSFPEVRKVILFGSRARGDAEERSDIDLAVEAQGLSQTGWLQLVDQLENLDTLLSVDIINLPEAAQTLRERILSEGKVVFEQSEKQAKFD